MRHFGQAEPPPAITLLVDTQGRAFVDGQEVFVPLTADPWEVALAEGSAHAQELGLELPVPAVAFGPDGRQWSLLIGADGSAVPLAAGRAGAGNRTPGGTAGSLRGRRPGAWQAAVALAAVAAVSAVLWAAWPAPGGAPARGHPAAASSPASARAPARQARPSPSPAPVRPRQHPRGAASPASTTPASAIRSPSGPALCRHTDPSGSVYLEPCPTQGAH